MLSQILKASVVLLLMSIACKQDKTISKSVSHNKEKAQKSKDKIISSLNNKDFSLNIETYFSKDTLNVVDYKEDIYSSPIIIFQKLSFYNKNKLIKTHQLPLKNVNKKTITDKVISATGTPIYKACLSKKSNQDFYIVNGSDYCNGSDCPEFIGIYLMNGDIIYEGFSNEKKKHILKNIIVKNSIDLNKLTNCIDIDIFK
ncbi:hypothetical protein [Flavobacterium defluvii]|uniref:Uncharacterized protein n=1 Tax=Flavobacterium defluvii TaxID=370979 RepID=A0A1M5WL84_9FLAO|nr:hypothetical protein [Flavobacterium defluvii]SHH88208.1 hypothetical protein SAMN05443663_11449 [Flavobacterium defluvii]